jgi:hypothetical protein
MQAADQHIASMPTGTFEQLSFDEAWELHRQLHEAYMACMGCRRSAKPAPKNKLYAHDLLNEILDLDDEIIDQISIHLISRPWGGESTAAVGDDLDLAPYLYGAASQMAECLANLAQAIADLAERTEQTLGGIPAARRVVRRTTKAARPTRPPGRPR